MRMTRISVDGALTSAATPIPDDVVLIPRFTACTPREKPLQVSSISLSGAIKLELEIETYPVVACATIPC